jgi:hypothetical protein
MRWRKIDLGCIVFADKAKRKGRYERNQYVGSFQKRLETVQRKNCRLAGTLYGKTGAGLYSAVNG